MQSRPNWRIVAALTALVSFAIVGAAWRTPPARVADGASTPPPIWMPIIGHGFQTASASFLGMNGGPIDGNTGTGAYEGDLAYFPTLRSKSFDWMNVAGLNWYRNYGSDSIVYSWRFVEPASGQYDWSFWDQLVQQAQSHHITLLASIGNGVPSWANGKSDWRIPPSDLYAQPMQSTAWYQYVYHFVDRYSGSGQNTMPGLQQPIKYWEFWNEADLLEGWNPPLNPPHEFTGSVQDYVRLRAVAYAAVKAVDPSAVVVGPATAQTPGNSSTVLGGVHWFIWTWNDFVNAGGLQTLDAVSFTHYLAPTGWDVAGDPEFFFSMVDQNRGGKPVWMTETGWLGSPGTNYQEKSRSLVRIVVIAWSEPWIQHFFWYDFQEQSLIPNNNHRGLLQTSTGTGATGVEPDPLFHPAFRVAELMQKILGAFTSADHPVALDVGADSRAYHFSGHGQDVWVAWYRPETGSATITINTGGRTVRVISLYGQDLGLFSGGSLNVGADPIYLTTNLAWNQNVGRITGRLHDGSQPNVLNNGVVSATVTINGTGNLTATAQTDSDGNYVFSNLPDGQYHVTVHGPPSSPPSYDLAVGREIFWGQTSFTVTVSAGH